MTDPGKQLNRKSIRGFTLIEILVASSVMVVLVGIVAYIASAVMGSWNRSSGKLSANAEARFVLDVIGQDLETAVLCNNGQQWLRVDQATLAGNAPYTSDQSDSVTLKLFAPALDQANDNGIYAIAYKLEYQPTYPNGPDTYALYRMVINPQATMANYLSSKFDDPTDSATVQSSLQGNGIGTANWSNAAITNTSNYLAGNIVSFKIFVYDEASIPKPANADPALNTLNKNYAYGGIFPATDPNNPSAPENTNQPLYADIILTVVTDQGMELLNNIKQNLIPDDPADVVMQHGETFIRRVYFKSNTL